MVSEASIEKKLPIPASAPTSSKDGRIREFAGRSAEIMYRGAHAIDGELVRSRVEHNTSLADVFPPCFELRLDEDDSLQCGLRALPHRRKHRREHQGGRNERHVHGYKTYSAG